MRISTISKSIFIFFASQNIMASEVDKSEINRALTCSEGFTQSRVCDLVSGIHNFNKFSLCLKQNGSAVLPEIKVVLSSGNDLLSKDSGTFESVKDIQDDRGNPTVEIELKGQLNFTEVTDTKKSGQYTRYRLVPNVDFKRDSTWTHKLYAVNHVVTQTRAQDGTWKQIDVGLAVGVQNTPNKFLCFSGE